MNIEILESRIAPASLTFTDVDGDKVVITTSGPGTLTLGVNVIVTAGQLQTLDLMGPAFQGANVSIVATRDPVLGGDGFVNVGRIDATGRDLGTVLIDGDLGAIDAGNSANPASACKGLTAQSLGRFGTSTGSLDLVSDFDGRLDKLAVKFDVNEARIVVGDSAGTNAKIGSIAIGGSLIGGAASQSGFIVAPHGIGAVTIGGDVVGGSGDNSGKLRTLGTLGPVKIGGSVRGDGAFSGLIDAAAIVSVKIGGSLIGGAGDDSGEIFAGTSIGPVTIGEDVQGGAGAFSGAIRSVGTIGTVKIGGDVQGASGSSSGLIRSEGNLASVSVGGSIIGGSNTASGGIRSFGDMGAVKIGHDVQGGSGIVSGFVRSDGKLAGVSIGGSLIGGSNNECGEIRSQGDMGAVKIGHDVKGGSGSGSGFILSVGKIAGVSIGGSLIGGSGIFLSGVIFSTGDVGAVKIGHDIIGGNVSGFAALAESGYIQGQRIASLFVGGSIRAGVDDSSGTLTSSGAVSAVDDIGPVTIKGSLVGSIGTGGDLTFAVISAGGQAGPDVAIKSISIGGRVELAQILAGYDTALNPTNADAQIGAVTVGGDWIASRMAAGSLPGTDTIPGTNDDTVGGGNPAIISKIASILIKGQALGTLGGADSFAFIAQKIGSFKIGGTSVPLSANGADFEVIGATGDLFLIDFM